MNQLLLDVLNTIDDYKIHFDSSDYIKVCDNLRDVFKWIEAKEVSDCECDLCFINTDMIEGMIHEEYNYIIDDMELRIKRSKDTIFKLRLEKYILNKINSIRNMV